MFIFSSRRRHTRLQGDWSSDVCSSDLTGGLARRLQHRCDLDWMMTVVVDDSDAVPLAGLGKAPLDAAEPCDGAEIGRASCREGVWSSLNGAAVERKSSRDWESVDMR